MTPTSIEIIATVLFALAIAHTFSTGFFLRLAQQQPAHAGIWHLLGEVEVVFGFWAMVLVVAIAVMADVGEATAYVDSRSFTEPLFVFAIMTMAATRPVLWAATKLVDALAKLLPWRNGLEFCFAVLALVPLLGSVITEPAAMTLAALMLSRRVYASGVSTRCKYALLGVLFVNVSIGGVLTPFAAPPVLMVAGKWNWDFAFMLVNFGWKAAIAVTINAAAVVFAFRRELAELPLGENDAEKPMPLALVFAHLLFLAGVVVFAHHPAVFMGIFLLFLGVATAYARHQDRLILREALLVAFFLAGLVVLGGKQQWWLEPMLMTMSADAVFFGATALTAVTDNAALTYLGSLAHGLTEEFKIALVAGAVAGGGLTVIANAPNPAGLAIVRRHFDDEAVHPLGLLLAALPPTVVAILALRWL